MAGLVVGALIGAIVFWASRLDGVALFILAGATAGTVAALLVHAYSQNLSLQGVTITIPQLSELHFVLAPDNRRVAWQLFVETSTRVSTQPLQPGSGSLREAMASLYNLFQVTRSGLRESSPSRAQAQGPTVEDLGIAMLNLELRPFLSRWHPLLATWERTHPKESEESWEGNLQCRAELTELQLRLKSYVNGFAALAGAQLIEESAPSAVRSTPSKNL